MTKITLGARRLLRRASGYCAAGAMFLAGATGMAAEPASIVVHADESLGAIDPLIFGYFTEETLGSFEGGIWSELLYNRKFGFEDRQGRVPMAQPGTSAGWSPLTYDGYAPLVLDPNEFLSPPFSQRITLTKKDSGPSGIFQSGLQRVLVHFDLSGRQPLPFNFEPGEEYLVSLAINAGDFDGPVYVALGASPSDTVAEHAFTPEGDGWQTYETTLTPSAAAEDAKFMIYIRDEGTVRVDSASFRLASVTADNGFRSDGLQITRDVVKPTNLRWPGGCYADDYHWKNGIGPRDERPDVWTRPWQDWCANDVGTDEFIELCRSLNTVPYICVNYGTGTPEEAAAWVEYCNGDATSEWGKVRAENGHPEPYNVKYWNIGNEIFLGTEFGGTNGADYAQGYLRFVEAMRAVDPDIEFVSVGQYPMPEVMAQVVQSDSPFKAMLRFWPNWSEDFLSIAADEVDQFSIHYYAPGNVANLGIDDIHRRVLTIGDGLARQTDAIYALKQEVAPNAAHFPLALDEWGEMMDNAAAVPLPENLDVPEGADINEVLKNIGLIGPLGNLRQALGKAGALNVVHRRPGDFGLGNKKILYASVAGDIVFSRDAAVIAPAGLMMGLYATDEACEALRVETTSENFAVTSGEPGQPGREAPYIDASARRSVDGKTIEVFVIDRNWESEIPVTIACEGAENGQKVEVLTLNGPELIAINTFKTPESVSITKSEASVSDGKIEIDVPAHALVKLVIAQQ